MDREPQPHTQPFQKAGALGGLSRLWERLGSGVAGGIRLSATGLGRLGCPAWGWEVSGQAPNTSELLERLR